MYLLLTAKASLGSIGQGVFEHIVALRVLRPKATAYLDSFNNIIT